MCLEFCDRDDLGEVVSLLSGKPNNTHTFIHQLIVQIHLIKKSVKISNIPLYRGARQS